jgi:P-type Ca2+ transporter type 2C
MVQKKKQAPVLPSQAGPAWHAMEAGETVAKLGSQLDLGLSTELADQRLLEFGPNQLAEKPRPSFFALVFDQLKSFVILLLIAASIISIIVNEPVDAIVILAIVVLNAILGVVQESRAEEALAALKKMAAPDSQVIRDGKRLTVPSAQLVPGDIVLLEAGNFIPADLRLIESMNLRIDEAPLTGESVSVQKNALTKVTAESGLGDRKNMAFRGTVVTYGRGKGVVVETGMKTELGKIAELLSAVENEETPLQKALDKLGKTLGWACLIVCAIVFTTGLLEGGDPLKLFMIAVSLAIAAVPEGLPAIVTISLALGMQEMIKRHALIRKLSSVETLGSTTVICSDKTGTLTQNEMTVTRVWVDGNSLSVTGQGYTPEGEFMVDDAKADLNSYPGIRTALWVGALNNDAVLEKTETEDGVLDYKMVGDPTEGSILVAALKAGGFAPVLNKAYPRIDEVPFDSERKRMITIHSIDNPTKADISPFVDEGHKKRHVIAIKGAPDMVLNLCTGYQPIDDGAAKPMDKGARERVLAANDAMTKDALRVLGVAYRLVDEAPENASPDVLEKDMIFVGLIGMIDPARAEVKPALHTAAKAGIRTIMITGDYPNTARAIAESIGLLRPHHKVMSGAELDDIDDKTLKKEVEVTDVFARVSPEHKMRIVDALKANGEVVAMTGDGVNDAPAIKRADIGVSMGITGTDVAKETADMVLTDDNYVSIVSAVEQGRIIYSNIRKFVYYLISCNMAEIFIIFLPTAFGRFLIPYIPALSGLSAEQLAPLTAIQLLWLNLVTDGAPALALGTEKGDPDIMDQKPRPAKEPIINKGMLAGVIMQTIAIAGVTLFAFFNALRLGHDLAYAETMAFATLSISELVRAFTARSERYPILKIGVFKNKWMNLAVLSSLVMILAVIYVPFLQGLFQTEALGLAEWELVLPLLLVPSVVAELTKVVQNAAAKRKK